jgi:hypothetical protein
MQGLLKKNEKKIARSFNFMFRYTDAVPSLNNSKFGDFFDNIYPIAGAAGMLLHINIHINKFTMRKLKSTFCRAVSF